MNSYFINSPPLQVSHIENWDQYCFGCRTQLTPPIIAYEKPISPPSKSLNSILTTKPLLVNKNKDPDAEVKFILLNMEEKYKFIDKNIHEVYYYTRKVVNGKVMVCFNYDNVLKKFPSIKLLTVTTIQDKDGKILSTQNFEEDEIKNEVNELSILIETNGKSEKTTFLSFKDKKSEKFKTSIKLKDSTTRNKRINNNKNNDNNNGYDEDLLNILFRFGLKEMYKIKEMAKKKNVFNVKDIKYIEDSFKTLIKNPELDFRSIIFSKAKNEKKEELKKLCFDSLFEFIINIENDNTCLIKYIETPKLIQFLKEYPFGKSYQNHVIIIEDNLKNENERKRDKNSETEEPQDRKKQKIDVDGNIILQT